MVEPNIRICNRVEEIEVLIELDVNQVKKLRRSLDDLYIDGGQFNFLCENEDGQKVMVLFQKVHLNGEQMELDNHTEENWISSVIDFLRIPVTIFFFLLGLYSIYHLIR